MADGRPEKEPPQASEEAPREEEDVSSQAVEESSQDTHPPVRVDGPVFWIALATLLVFGGGLLMKPDASLLVLKKALAYMTHELGSIYLWFTFLATLWLAWLAFGRFGSQRFGAPDSKPDYSTISWFGMLFCAGLGSNLLYFGTMEWMWYYLGPPPGVAAKTAEAAVWAGAYSYFH